MCVGGNNIAAPKATAESKPVFIRNPYLDEKENADGVSSRADRASLVVPLEQSIGFEGRGGTGSGTRGGAPSGATGFARPARSSASLTIGPSPRIEPLIPGMPGAPPLPAPGPRLGVPGRTVDSPPAGDPLPTDPRIRRPGIRR